MKYPGKPDEPLAKIDFTAELIKIVPFFGSEPIRTLLQQFIIHREVGQVRRFWSSFIPGH
jgi:hypothetical protein